MPKLGVNIDHVATLRQARYKETRLPPAMFEPDPIAAASICELAGADSIVCHLREDRRHINEKDLWLLKETVKTKLNLEMSINSEIVKIATRVKPNQATLVPEKRQEITTEGGLDAIKNFKKIKHAIALLKKADITVSLFIDPDEKQIKQTSETGAEFVELHTGCYANAIKEREIRKQLQQLNYCTQLAISLGLRVNAGHGLNYVNVKKICSIVGIEELNIGHSIISRAVFAGLEKAVSEMKGLISK